MSFEEWLHPLLTNVKYSLEMYCWDTVLRCRSVASRAQTSWKLPRALPGVAIGAQVTSGKVYEGVFAGLGTEDGAMSIAIKYAKLIKDPEAAPGSEKETLAERPKRNLCIKPASLVQLIAKDVRFNALVRRG